MIGRLKIFRFKLLCFCFLSAACGRSDKAEPGSIAESGPVSATTGATTGAAASASPEVAGRPASACPRTGRWAVCSLEKRLEQSGFVLRKEPGDHPPRSGFTVPPIVYALGPARLEVFIYPDESGLRRDVAGMDTTLAAKRGQANDWEIPPRFIRSGNLAAVFLTRNEQQAERLMLAITAGPPQPEPERP